LLGHVRGCIQIHIKWVMLRIVVGVAVSVRARVQNMKRAIKQIVGRGPNAVVALREFHRRLNSGVRLRSSLAGSLRWAFNLEAQTRGRGYNDPKCRISAALFCFVFCLFAPHYSITFFFFCAIDHPAYFSYWHVNGFDARTKESIRMRKERWIKLKASRVKRMKLSFFSLFSCYLGAPAKLFALFLQLQLFLCCQTPAHSLVLLSSLRCFRPEQKTRYCHLYQIFFCLFTYF
jgi:hypothetical protein